MAAARSSFMPWAIGLLATAVMLIALLFVSDAPFRNPAPADAEFIFTFRAYGDWISGAAAALPDPAHDPRPVHMRVAQPMQRTRSPLTVQVTVSGRAQEQIFRPKGFESDGFSVGELRVPLTPGSHRVAVSIATHIDPNAPRRNWTAEVEAVHGHPIVLTLDANRGFQLER